MRAFIQYENGIPANANTYAAQEGFTKLGAEIIPFHSLMAPEDVTRHDVVCGYIGTVKGALRKLGVVPTELDYPEELEPFYGRKVFKTDWSYVTDSANWPVFVKPVHQKLYTGGLIREFKDLIAKGDHGQEVWCAEPVEMLSEFRCFIRYGQIIGMKHYKGDPFIVPKESFVQQMLLYYTKKPAGFSLDVAVIKNKHGYEQTIVVEVNDGFSLGTYGLDGLFYAKLISARWAEMVNIPDVYQF